MSSPCTRLFLLGLVGFFSAAPDILAVAQWYEPFDFVMHPCQFKFLSSHLLEVFRCPCTKIPLISGMAGDYKLTFIKCPALLGPPSDTDVTFTSDAAGDLSDVMLDNGSVREGKMSLCSDGRLQVDVTDGDKLEGTSRYLAVRSRTNKLSGAQSDWVNQLETTGVYGTKTEFFIMAGSPYQCRSSSFSLKKTA